MEIDVRNSQGRAPGKPNGAPPAHPVLRHPHLNGHGEIHCPRGVSPPRNPEGPEVSGLFPFVASGVPEYWPPRRGKTRSCGTADHSCRPGPSRVPPGSAPNTRSRQSVSKIRFMTRRLAGGARACDGSCPPPYPSTAASQTRWRGAGNTCWRARQTAPRDRHGEIHCPAWRITPTHRRRGQIP